MTKRQRKEYFRCFYAYCKENYNKEFYSSDIPITNAMITNNDKQMDLIFKRIKVYNLYGKENLTTDKEGNKIFKIVFKQLGKDLKEFVILLDKKEENLKKYNYCQHALNNFIHELDDPKLGLMKSETLSNKISNKFGDKYIQKKIRYGGYDGYSAFVISYDELLEKYKEFGYVNDTEYEKLKGNYEKINYLSRNFEKEEKDDFYDNLPVQPITQHDKNELIDSLKESIMAKDEEIKEIQDENKKLLEEIEKLKAMMKEKEEFSTESNNDLIKEIEYMKKVLSSTKAGQAQLEKINKKVKVKNPELTTKQ